MVLAFRRVLKTLANRATNVGAMPANPYGLGKLRQAASNLAASAAISLDNSIWCHFGEPEKLPALSVAVKIFTPRLPSPREQRQPQP